LYETLKGFIKLLHLNGIKQYYFFGKIEPFKYKKPSQKLRGLLQKKLKKTTIDKDVPNQVGHRYIPKMYCFR